MDYPSHSLSSFDISRFEQCFKSLYTDFFNACFLRATTYAIARICHANSVRLSIRLSVTRMYCIQTAERIIEIFSLSDRPITLVFRHQGSLRKSDGFTLNGGAKYNGLYLSLYNGVAIFD